MASLPVSSFAYLKPPKPELVSVVMFCFTIWDLHINGKNVHKLYAATYNLSQIWMFVDIPSLQDEPNQYSNCDHN